MNSVIENHPFQTDKDPAVHSNLLAVGIVDKNQKAHQILSNHTSTKTEFPQERRGGNNPTIVISSEKSNKLKERKVRGSLVNRKKSTLIWASSSIFALYYGSFLMFWYIYEQLVSNHLSLSKNLFDGAIQLNLLYFLIADGVNSYISLATHHLSRNLITPGMMDTMKSVLQNYNDDPQDYFEQKLIIDIKGINDILDLLDSVLVQSSNNQAIEILGKLFKPLSINRSVESEEAEIPIQADMKRLDQQQSFKYVANGLADSLNNLKAISGKSDQSVEPAIYQDAKYRFKTFNKAFLNQVVQDILPNQLDLIFFMKNSLAKVAITSYYTPVTILLICITSVIPLLLFCLLVVLFLIQRDLSTIISTFSYLNKEDLFRELGQIEKFESFLNGSLFDAQKKMKEAISLTHQNSELENPQSPNVMIKRKKYQLKGSNISFLKASLGKRAGAISRASELRNRRPFSSVCLTCILSLILVSLIALGFLLLLMIDQRVKENSELRKSSLLIAEDILKIHRSFTSLMMYSPYSTNLIENSDSFSTPTEINDSFDRSVQTFLSHIQEFRVQVQKSIGFKTKAETLFYEDLCYQMKDELNDQEAIDHICRDLNYRMGTKGYIHFVIGEQKSVSIIQDKMNAIWSRSNLTNIIDDKLVDLWQSQDFFEVRVGHELITKNVLFIFLATLSDFLNQNVQKLPNLMDTLRIAGLSFVSVSFLVFVVVSYWLFKRDYQIALSTFEMLSPDTVLTNQYVLAIFNKFFQTTLV